MTNKRMHTSAQHTCVGPVTDCRKREIETWEEEGEVGNAHRIIRRQFRTAKLRVLYIRRMVEEATISDVHSIHSSRAVA
ncbi:hypothetical protein EVAR_85236_1 [Eumeta japonica]|uniref:Uncharacterized protein n=1 Tax=Eumeta variegata TaxID=151549 RepID=A0A4C1W0J6_EUMVA|nr:hypothetical protein EVAR_85236_1 [Eumeta japonica]